MNVTKVEECAEAICGGLHASSFEHLGDGNGSTWFTIGDQPFKKVRVEVQRSKLADYVNVIIEFHNIDRQAGRLVININAAGNRNDVIDVSGRAIVRCLSVFRDVLTGQGVAGHQVEETRAPAISTDEFDSGPSD